MQRYWWRFYLRAWRRLPDHWRHRVYAFAAGSLVTALAWHLLGW